MPDAKATFRLEGEDGTAAAFRSALGNVQDFSEKATQLLRGAFGFEIVNIFAEQVKGLAEMGDQLVKGAARAGIAQGEFNQLAAAFQEADVSGEALSKGLQKLEISISKAAAGGKAQTEAFNEMGLSVDDLKKLKPEDQLLAIAEAVSKIEDPTDRARLGFVVMGKAFLEMEPVLLKGAAGLDEVVRAANGMDAETVEKMAKFNEQLNHLANFFKSQVANDVAYFVDSIKQVHDQFSPDMATRIEQIQTMLRSPGNWGEDRVRLLTQELKDLQWEMANMHPEQSEGLKSALDIQGGGFADKFAAEWEKASEAAVKEIDKIDKENKATLESWQQELSLVDEKRIENEIKFDELIKAHMANRAVEFAYLDQQENAHAAAMDKAQNSGAISAAIKARQDEFKDSMAVMTEQAKEAEANNKKLFDKTGQYAVQTGELIQSTFAQAFLNIGQGGLRGLVANFIKAFATIVANAEAMDLAKAMGITDAFSNQGGGSALGGIFGGIGSMFGGDSTAISFNNGAGTAGLLGFAGGGSFNVGGSGGTDSQLVAFKATPGEQVSIKTPGQGGGVTVVNNNYIDSRTDSTQIAQLIQASTQRAVQQSKSEMTQLIKRGAFA